MTDNPSQKVDSKKFKNNWDDHTFGKWLLCADIVAAEVSVRSYSLKETSFGMFWGHIPPHRSMDMKINKKYMLTYMIMRCFMTFNPSKASPPNQVPAFYALCALYLGSYQPFPKCVIIANILEFLGVNLLRRIFVLASAYS